MSRLTKRVALFLLVFIVTTAVLIPLWDLAAPHYERLAAGVARPLFHVLERPDVTVVDARGGEIWILRRLDEQRVTPFLFFDRYAFFAVIPLLALFVATPGLGVLRRALRAFAGMAALFVLQVLYVVVAVELAYAAAGLSTPAPLVSGALDGWQVLVRILWEAGPLLIWVALSWGAWRRFVRELRAQSDGVVESAESRRRGRGARLGETDTREGWLA